MSGHPFSWMHPGIEIRESQLYGKGAFAKTRLVRDEILFVMGGYILTIEDENELRGTVADKPIELSDRFSIGPRRASDLPRMPQHYVNHSCEPNAGFKGQVFLVAMRSITPGEEITFDYAMVMHPNSASTSQFAMTCACGRPSCRGLITEDDWRQPELQQRYDGYFTWWLQEKICQARKQRRSRAVGKSRPTRS